MRLVAVLYFGIRCTAQKQDDAHSDHCQRSRDHGVVQVRFIVLPGLSSPAGMVVWNHRAGCRNEFWHQSPGSVYVSPGQQPHRHVLGPCSWSGIRGSRAGFDPVSGIGPADCSRWMPVSGNRRFSPGWSPLADKARHTSAGSRNFSGFEPYFLGPGHFRWLIVMGCSG